MCMRIGHHRREPNSEDERKGKPNVPQQEASPSQGARPSNDHVFLYSFLIFILSFMPIKPISLKCFHEFVQVNMFLDALEKSVDRAVRKKKRILRHLLARCTRRLKLSGVLSQLTSRTSAWKIAVALLRTWTWNRYIKFVSMYF